MDQPNAFDKLAAISAVATYSEASRLKFAILDSDVSLPNHVSHEVPSQIPTPPERLEKFVSDLAQWQIILLSRLRWNYDPALFFGVSRHLLPFFAEHKLKQLEICQTIWEKHIRRRMRSSELAKFRSELTNLWACLNSPGLESETNPT